MSASSPRLFSRFVLLTAIVITCVGCDQATKVYAVRHLKPLQQQPPRSYLADTIRITYVENPGAFLGMGGNLRPDLKFWVLTIPTTLILCGVIVMVFTNPTMDRWTLTALAMIVAGESATRSTASVWMVTSSTS